MKAVIPANTLRERLTATLVLALTVWSLLSAAAAYLLARHFTTQAYDRSLRGSLLDINRQIRVVNGRATIDLPPAALEMLEWNELDRVYYRILTGSGATMAGDAEVPLPPVPPDGTERYYDGRHKDVDVRVAAMTFPVDGTSDRLMIIVAETTDARRAITRKILIATLATATLLVAVALVVIWLAVGRSLAPLSRLREDISRRSDHDLSAIDTGNAPGEVRPLVDALNSLFTRLDSALASHRRFVANAAHQLRTPLAGLRTQTELALRETDPQTLKTTLAQVHRASERASHLVNQLMSLARLEPRGGRPVQIEELDLNELARDTTSHWVPRALDAKIDLGFEPAAAAARVMGDRLLLEELLGNLLDNALRYTPAGGEVTVRVEESDKHPAVMVEDNGPGIPEDERELVLERFHRGRNTQQSPGSGLGLSIVREIAQTHGASVSVGPGRDGTGTRIAVRFPRR